jgi:hypothetical protein
MSLHFQLELNTLGFLSVPTDKNLKDSSQHIGLYLENCLWTYVNMNFFLVFWYGALTPEVCPSI